MYLRYVLAFLFSFALTILFSPFVFKMSRKIKAEQTILHYVKEHESKQGTSTMGGIMFIIPTIITSLIFFDVDYMLAMVTLVVFFAYGILGFLDDFIKVKFKQNLGLRAYQKIIGQLGISLIVALFVYKYVGTEIAIPFTDGTIDLGFWIIPFIVLIYVATVNSVNLIDGMDGLCSGVSINYVLAFSIILMSIITTLTGVDFSEVNNIISSNYALLGGLFAFLMFNHYPAKIFMGDTGSLAIGGYIATISILTGLELLIPLLGLLFVVTALSDILQVMHYKRTKRRIFKMAPLHHHFQMSGVHESKIVFVYFAISFISRIIQNVKTKRYRTNHVLRSWR